MWPGQVLVERERSQKLAHTLLYHYESFFFFFFKKVNSKDLCRLLYSFPCPNSMKFGEKKDITALHRENSKKWQKVQPNAGTRERNFLGWGRGSTCVAFLFSTSTPFLVKMLVCDCSNVLVLVALSAVCTLCVKCFFVV